MKLSFPVATPETRDESMLALRGDVSRAFAQLAALGYAGAELMVRDPDAIDTQAIGRAARDSGLAIVGVSTGQIKKEDRLSLAAPDAEVRRRALTRGRAAIEMAAAVGAPQVNVGSFRGDLTPAASTEALAIATESFAALVETATEAGVLLAIEIQSRFVVNWLNTVAETTAWIERLPGEKPRVLFDVYHAMLEESSIAAALIRAFPFVSYVQIADSNRLAIGRGHLAVGEIVQVLEALGYPGFIGVEVMPVPSALAAAEQSIRALRPLLE